MNQLLYEIVGWLGFLSRPVVLLQCLTTAGFARIASRGSRHSCGDAATCSRRGCVHPQPSAPPNATACDNPAVGCI